MNKLQIGITAIAAAVALVGCGQQSGGGGGTEVKIGHVGPLTGGIAHLGKDNENGARLAVEEANAAKIKIDGKDVKFVFVAEDDQADPKVGTTVAQKLVDDAKVAMVQAQSQLETAQRHLQALNQVSQRESIRGAEAASNAASAARSSSTGLPQPSDSAASSTSNRSNRRHQCWVASTESPAASNSAASSARPSRPAAIASA